MLLFLLFLFIFHLFFPEQLQRMDNALDDTNDSLTRSERIIRGMKSIGGAISQSCNPETK